MALTLGDVLRPLQGRHVNLNRGMNRTEGEVTSWGQRLSGSMKRVLEIATGGLLANAGSKLAGMANNTLRTGFELVKNCGCKLQSLQSLAARELLNTGAAKDMTDALEKARVIGEQNISGSSSWPLNRPSPPKTSSAPTRWARRWAVNGDNLKILIQDTVDWAAAGGKSRDAMNDVFPCDRADQHGRPHHLGRPDAADHARYSGVGLPGQGDGQNRAGNPADGLQGPDPRQRGD